MKYRDPNTGEVFEEIEAARIAFCGMACQECKLSCWNNKDKTRCDIYCHAHPAEAARLMGLEVVEESFAERLEASVRREESMENTDKPLSEWTLGEMKSYCDRNAGKLCSKGCPFSAVCEQLDTEDMFVPGDWDLDDKPRFTQEEVAVLRYFADHLHIAYLTRRNDGGLFGGERPFQHNGDGFTSDGPIIGLPRTLFPSLRPGQAAKLEEIIG